MSGTLPAGPSETFTIADATVPAYVIPFDRTGASLAPLTERHLWDAAGDVTDVYLFAHGWNNDWDDAIGLFRRFMLEYDQVVRAHGPARVDTTSVFVGVFWPSIVLPETTAPQMAAGPEGANAGVFLSAAQALAEDLLPASDRPEFYALAQQPALGTGEAMRLAQLLLPLYGHGDQELNGPDGPVDVDGLTQLWRTVQEAIDEEASGPLVISGPRSVGVSSRDDEIDGPEAAGLPAVLDPRNIVRLATVLLMKDRAGVVGTRGARRLLAGLLERSDARLHLVGHSYGCRVLLSALCAKPLSRPVRSVLLLQPALSYLAFAETLPWSGAAGGYRSALSRTELPVMVTWTRQDIPLRWLFQLAVRRSTDIGEQDIGSAGLESPPSRFAAMGGWGPQAAAEVVNQNIRKPADGRYTFNAGARVYALESHAVIKGHSDIIQDATAWALYNLAAA